MKKNDHKKTSQKKDLCTNCHTYKKHVLDRLSALDPIFARAAVGDYSKDVRMHEEEDEFTQLYFGVQVMLEVVRDKIADLNERSDRIAVEAIRRTAKLHESNWAKAAIEKQNKELQGLNRLKTEFVSLASHQMRTPLSTASWYVEMMLAEETGALNDLQRKYLQKVYAANQRMRRLLDTFLNVSRVEAKTIQPKPTHADIVQICENALGEFQDMAREKNIATSFHAEPFLPHVWVDTDLVATILYNLIGNAMKYTPEDGSVYLDIACNGENAIISITDTGCGIPEKDQGRIFTKFFRAANVLNKDTDGNGLGLYLSKLIADLLGGKIWFESPVPTALSPKKKEGIGTVFHFTIPIAKLRNA